MNGDKAENYNENIIMRIFGALGMILVVAGHLKLDVFDAGGLFPYYSFHVYIFLFIAGYFYRPCDEEHIGRFALKKLKTLMLPYYVFNLIYGIIAAFLKKAGLTIGGELSLYNLFVAPFLGGHQFMYNFPAWFVPALFVTELLNAVMRKLLKTITSAVLGVLHKGEEAAKVEKIVDYAALIGTLVVGIMTVYLAKGGHVWGHYKDIGRILIMLPGIGFGRIYRTGGEKHMSDGILFNVLYFAVIIGVQLVIKRFCGGLAFSTVWVTSFANASFIPFVTVLTGCLLWLRIAYLIAKVGEFADEVLTEPLIHNRVFVRCKRGLRRCVSGLIQIGRSTFSIMTHHIFVLFLINTICYLICRKINVPAEAAGFDTALYKSDVSYLYPYLDTSGRLARWLNLVLCIAVPVCADALFKNIKAPLLRK